MARFLNANSRKYLASLYQLATEDVKKTGGDPEDAIGTGTLEYVIGRHAGLTPEESEQASNDLFDLGLVGQHSAPGDDGRGVCLKEAGYRMASSAEAS